MKLGLFVLVRACPAPQRQGERDRIAGKDLPSIVGGALFISVLLCFEEIKFI